MRKYLVLFIALCACSPVFSQFDAGQISGFIRDASGATVPNANVSATNEGSGEVHKVTANGEGYYIFPQLFVGKYTLTVEQAGFKTFAQKGITIDAQSKLTIDVALTLGSLNERVEVEASSAQVQTDSAKVGATIENKQIQNLTLNGRNPIYLAASDTWCCREPGYRNI